MNPSFPQTAVITGAASGIGLALARHAAAQGMQLVLADIDQTALSNAASTLGVSAERLLLCHTDVSRHGDVKALADAAYARFGVVDLLFNNAGVALGRVTWEHRVQDWEWVLGVNLWSVVYGIDVFLPRMQAAGRVAHIVNTASAAGLLSMPGMAAYNASKHAVVTLSETLYLELRASQSPVSVSLLCPAWVPTGIAQSERNRPPEAGQAQPAGELSASILRKIGKAIASGQLSADDIASATFDAIRDKRFYVIPHQALNSSIEHRMHDILAQRNPSVPG